MLPGECLSDRVDVIMFENEELLCLAQGDLNVQADEGLLGLCFYGVLSRGIICCVQVFRPQVSLFKFYL